MQNIPSREPADSGAKPILEWLSVARNRNDPKEISGLQRHLLALRATPLAPEQRLLLLNLLHDFATDLTLARMPFIQAASLPVSPGIRQQVRVIQDLLEALHEDYLGILPESAPRESAAAPSLSLDVLRRAMHCLARHLDIGHLVAAPPGTDIWRKLHATFRTAQEFRLDSLGETQNRIDQIYLSILLAGIAQPPSFTAQELEFVGRYIERYRDAVEISEKLPEGRSGVFWIDPDHDSPPQALARRTPAPGVAVLYFTCDLAARRANEDLAALEKGCPAFPLGLPGFAETPAGQGVLKRLGNSWGSPAKRRYPRRRQSYRANLCGGLGRIWQLLSSSRPASGTSEWMITNQSPDGYAMMHLSGSTERLQAGDVVALRLRQETRTQTDWQICLVRWALSEHPEHIELGLQVLAARGTPAKLIPPDGRGGAPIAVILLPELPPLRPFQSLITPAGTIAASSQKLTVLVEQGNFAVYNLCATRLEERTSSIEVFSVEPDGKP